MRTRPELLVHWTGRKTIPNRLSRLTRRQRQQYVDLAFSILNGGFWMSKPPEVLEGRWGTIQYQVDIVCFTEVRLSKTKTHADNYGYLGIAVSRNYVLNRGGGPVHYVRSVQSDAVVGNVGQLYELFLELERREALQNTGPNPERPMALLQYNSAFLKSMSPFGKKKENLANLEEQEWRIVMEQSLVANNLVRPVEGKGNVFAVVLNPDDIEMIILPDDRTKQLFLADERYHQWVAGRRTPPVTMTVRDCSQF